MVLYRTKLYSNGNVIGLHWFLNPAEFSFSSLNRIMINAIASRISTRHTIQTANEMIQNILCSKIREHGIIFLKCMPYRCRCPLKKGYLKASIYCICLLYSAAYLHMAISSVRLTILFIKLRLSEQSQDPAERSG